jgi:ABC-type transporter Mla MlaB component
MLMITPISSPDGSSVTLKLEGQLLCAWVAELHAACDRHFATVAHRRLDLRHVTFVDDAGAALLRTLIDQGVRIDGCSGFVAELLSLENR